MENPCLTGKDVFGKAHQPSQQVYTVVDTDGIERFCGSFSDCESYAMDVETGRIPCDLIIVPVF